MVDLISDSVLLLFLFDLKIKRIFECFHIAGALDISKIISR